MNENIVNYSMSIEYIKNITLDNFDSSKILFLKSNFITENSKDINDYNVAFALANIDRVSYVIKLSNLLFDIKIAIAIEMSIFEFSLIHMTLKNIVKDFIPAIYDDKFVDIFVNLDENSRLKNKTLRRSVLEGIINPKIIAFLSPDQIHPECWAPILMKIEFRQTTENNMATTDFYTCRKCGEKKSKVTELQLRSADEPGTSFITCLVCYNTFLK